MIYIELKRNIKRKERVVIDIRGFNKIIISNNYLLSL